MKSYVFIKNTVVMTFTALILRTAGIVLKVWLANRIGSEGIGLYQLILSVYALASTFATAGICTAVTRIISENLNKGKTTAVTVIKKAVLLNIIIAGVSAFIVYNFSSLISNSFLKDSRADLSVKILSFSLAFMGISSCFRGYFVSRKKMLKPSIAQIFEQAVRITVIAIVLPKAEKFGLEFSTAAILLADTVAEAVSCGLLFVCFLKDIKLLEKGEKISGVYRNIKQIALPITVGRYITVFLRTVENVIVPVRLTMFNQNKSLSLSQFGTLRGMVIPLIFFPSSFLMSVSTMLIPEMSEAKKQQKNIAIKYKAGKTVNITVCSSVFLATVFFVCANGLGKIVYNSDSVGQMIKFLAPVIPFMYLESVIDGLNKGLNQQKYSFWYNSLDSVIRIVIIFACLHRTGIKGFLLLMIVSNVTTCSLNFYRLKKAANINLNIKNAVIKPLFCSVAGGITAKTITNLLAANLSIKITAVLQIFIISVVFFSGMWLLKGFELLQK